MTGNDDNSIIGVSVQDVIGAANSNAGLTQALHEVSSGNNLALEKLFVSQENEENGIMEPAYGSTE
jgi:hypothetical protein